MEDLNPVKDSSLKRKSLGIFPTKSQPGKLLLISMFLVTVFMLGGVSIVFYLKSAPEENFLIELFDSLDFSFFSKQESEEKESEEDLITDDSEDVVVDEVSEQDSLGQTMVYTWGSELRVLYDDGSFEVLDILVSPFGTDEDIFFFSHPRLSPDGTKILYSSNNDIKIYDLILNSSEIVFDANDVGTVDGLFNSVLARYTWKTNDEIIFVSESSSYDDVSMSYLKTIKTLNIETELLSDWGTFSMATGFGGASTDPSVWYSWNFEDLIGIDHDLLYDGTYVYFETYIDQLTWGKLPEGGVFEPITESDLMMVKELDSYEISNNLTEEYVSDVSIQDYVLEITDTAPLVLSYYDVEIQRNNLDFYNSSAFGVYNLVDDGEYLYFTEIENSSSFAEALDTQSIISEEFIFEYFPQVFIKRVNIETEEVEILTLGLDFDLF